MKFADIIGQEELKRHLAQSVDAGRVSHAQLFTGQAGAGALALAVAYVQYLCCRHRHDGDSCGECPDCRQIAELAHPDLHWVFPVNKQGKKSGEVMRSDDFLDLFRALFTERGGYFSPQEWYDRLDLGKTLKGMIAAREADDIIRKLSYKSFESDYKIMLVWLPETMNEEAANKILKILEEPWEKTLFLLVSEQPALLLPTIISRTQEVHVPRIAPEVLERLACEQGVDDPLKARNLARLASGDLLTLKQLIAGENDATQREDFSLFCALMRLSYNDKHLELVTWAEEVAQLSREQQRAFLRDS
ncbi:MAG: DNA polymerase III subunit delta, partial [Alistipes sp.]|nr:DNA polymerase III subunit delta [Alistipes sp.]